MTLEEYKEVESLDYNGFCKYLKDKYGAATEDYYTKSFVRNPKVSRTGDGLFAHHVMEDRAILLSTREVAMRHPWAYQAKENIVYCDWVEHLYAHLLISENPAPNAEEGVGIGGCINFLVPQLNDIFAGFASDKTWEQNCINRVFEAESGRDAYFLVVSRLKVHLASLLRGRVPAEELAELCNYYLCSSAHDEDEAFMNNYAGALESFIYKPIRSMPTDRVLQAPGTDINSGIHH